MSDNVSKCQSAGCLSPVYNFPTPECSPATHAYQKPVTVSQHVRAATCLCTGGRGAQCFVQEIEHTSLGPALTVSSLTRRDAHRSRIHHGGMCYHIRTRGDNRGQKCFSLPSSFPWSKQDTLYYHRNTRYKPLSGVAVLWGWGQPQYSMTLRSHLIFLDLTFFVRTKHKQQAPQGGLA